ncbi:hypothetical protein NLM59_11450 [Weeksellaceae bacterium KMM 9724]|uniref:hypothetical protein n=1 Tax=Profundicola chukchiensis TaxID=2961959 RepID=UPI00243B08AF|nr:hypothetical protein [Profundicola chukchiensis]MDG4951538.1 hypothetical protein [Profundicola chukchiensis]
MKNLFTFYILILAPLGILFWLNKSDLINGTLFVGLIIFYALIYRTYTDGKRLADKNIIAKKDIWKMIIPGNRLEHFKELYLK